MSLSQGSFLSLLLIILLSIGLCAAQSNETAHHDIQIVSADLGLGAFSAAVEKAGLANTLNNQGVLLFGSGSFVIFAPSDGAFANATDISGAMENRTELRRILSHHLVWNDGSLGNLSQTPSLQTLEGENLTLEDGNGLRVNGAKVLSSQNYDNGTVYVIDRVLVPKKSESMGVIEAADRLGAKKFSAALKSEGFAERLNGQGLMGIESLSEGPFTVFAPSDAAFDNVLKATMDSIGKREGGMRTLLSYHMVEASGLVNRTDLGSVKTLTGDSLAVDASLGLVGGAKVLDSERYDNGIVYVIDQVLIPVRLSM